MATNNVKNVNITPKSFSNFESCPNYWQIDHKIKNISEVKGVTILSSPEAWKKFKWTRKWFMRQPKEGYFIWVKKQINFPLSSCVTIASSKISQDLINLIIIEKGIVAKTEVMCSVAKNNLSGIHKAQGKLILKDNASLEYNHLHQWGEKDFISSDYEFLLGENSRLNYVYKNLLPPKNLDLKTTIHSNRNSSSNLSFAVNGLNSNIGLKDTLFLEGQNAQGIIRLRLVGRKNSQIKAKSSIVAQAPGKGHLDCQGLLVNKNSTVALTPELICQDEKAQITHEALIGKISEEELNYLRARGLTETEAINLIIAGFLEI